MDGGHAGGSSGSCPFIRRSTKRNFSEMADDRRSGSPDSLFVPEEPRYDNHHRPQSHHNGLALPSLHTRFPGDGLDFRRPVMSGGGGAGVGSSSHMAIDLTEDDHMEQEDREATVVPSGSGNSRGSQTETRGDRHARIGMGGGLYGHTYHDSSVRTHGPSISRHLAERRERDHPRYSVLRHPSRTSSNMEDVEITNMRPRRHPAPATSRGHTPGIPAQRSITPFPPGNGDTIDLTGDNDDDIVILDARPRQGDNLARPEFTAGAGTRSVAEQHGTIADLLNNGTRLMERVRGYGHVFGGFAAGAGLRPNLDPGHQVLRFAPMAAGNAHTIMMDYALPAFDMGYAGANRPPSPKYEPPEDAAPGFTRSPGEDDVVVCPNCGDELAMGENEIKQQIWVIKKCGHAYCGNCAHNRSRTAARSKKGKDKAVETYPTSSGVLPLPFKKCVVEDCGAPAGATSMVHVFLS